MKYIALLHADGMHVAVGPFDSLEDADRFLDEARDGARFAPDDDIAETLVVRQPREWLDALVEREGVREAVGS